MRDTVTVMLDERGSPHALAIPTVLLRVVKGPDHRAQKKVCGSRVLVGASPACDLQLTDPTVSALHAEILFDQQGARVRDCGAKNGVVLENRRVSEAQLKDRDVLKLGASSVRVEFLDETESRELSRRTSFGALKGSSLPMRELYRALERAAASEASVLLMGETGTGKELAAEALVAAGPRQAKPFVVVDCGRLPSGTAESELFGHEKGAFTGATSEFAGAFERADGGTLFLDEVGELPSMLQPKLLGVLERRTVQRLGGARPRSLDLRVIAATNRDLEREVNRGTFRADLYFRLSSLQIRLPALRDHREDVPELVAHFLSELPGGPTLPAMALSSLVEQDYPGNVRQLRAAVERAVLGLESGAPPPPPGQAIDLEVPFRLAKDRLVRGFEHAYLSRLLDACEGNVAEASRRSGISRVHLHGLLQRHRIVRRDE